MANTGYQRGLTLTINKYVNGNLVSGYPNIYYGRNAFTWNSVNYPAITPTELAEMDTATFDTRLAAFKAYVQNLEAGLDIDAVATNAAYQQNLGACPLPY